MNTTIPVQPENSFRIMLKLDYSAPRLDAVLHKALLEQTENTVLKTISKTALKDMFNNKKVFIKGQRAKSSSSLAKGITYVDIIQN